MKYTSPQPHLRFMQNVEDFIDNLIRDHGDVLFYVWAILSLIAIAWILSGGLRRRMNRKVTRYVLVALPIAEPPPVPGRRPPAKSQAPALPHSVLHQQTKERSKDSGKPDDSEPLAFSM